MRFTRPSRPASPSRRGRGEKWHAARLHRPGPAGITGPDMPRLRIWKSNFERARDRCELTDDELAHVNGLIGNNTGDLVFDADALPVALARALLDDGKITPNDRAVLALRVRGMSGADALDVARLYDTTVASPVEFASILAASGHGQANESQRGD